MSSDNTFKFNPSSQSTTQPPKKLSVDSSEEEFRKAWDGENRRGMQMFQVCNACGGGSISTCECAYARWRKRKVRDLSIAKSTPATVKSSGEAFKEAVRAAEQKARTLITRETGNEVFVVAADAILVSALKQLAGSNDILCEVERDITGAPDRLIRHIEARLDEMRNMGLVNGNLGNVGGGRRFITMRFCRPLHDAAAIECAEAEALIAKAESIIDNV